MGRTKKITLQVDENPRPMLAPDSRMKQLKALAVDNAEEQLRNGTASSQVITYFLKCSPEEEEIKLENLRLQNELLKAKIEESRSTTRLEEMTANALQAFRIYSGTEE